MLESSKKSNKVNISEVLFRKCSLQQKSILGGDPAVNYYNF